MQSTASSVQGPQGSRQVRTGSAPAAQLVPEEAQPPAAACLPVLWQSARAASLPDAAASRRRWFPSQCVLFGGRLDACMLPLLFLHRAGRVKPQDCKAKNFRLTCRPARLGRARNVSSKKEATKLEKRM